MGDILTCAEGLELPVQIETQSEVVRPSGDINRSREEIESTLSAPSDLYGESKSSGLLGQFWASKLHTGFQGDCSKSSQGQTIQTLQIIHFILLRRVIC